MTGHYKEPYSETIDQLRAENKRLRETLDPALIEQAAQIIIQECELRYNGVGMALKGMAIKQKEVLGADGGQIMEHSKLPWYVKEPTSCICATLDGVPDIKIAEADIIQNNWKANAAFIVKAVNCHDELLEACKDCLCFIQELSDRGIVSDWSGEKDLINAIAKAEKK